MSFMIRLAVAVLALSMLTQRIHIGWSYVALGASLFGFILGPTILGLGKLVGFHADGKTALRTVDRCLEANDVERARRFIASVMGGGQ